MRPQHLFFVDLRPQRPLAAVVSSLSAPLVVEEIVELESVAMLGELCRKWNPKAHYTRAHVAIYPPNRFLRHAILENPAKARDESFFDEFLKSKYQIALSENAVMILNPSTGLPVDLEKVVPKELILTGAPQKEIADVQTSIVAQGIYPDRLELGSVSTIGALMHYLRAQQIGSCAAHLEWGATESLFTICSAKRVELSRVVSFGTQTLLEELKSDLHLKEVSSAQKVLTAASFDFNEMGPVILQHLIKELQASSGFFEVQTGQPLKHFAITLLPREYGWVEPILSKYMGLSLLSVDYVGWANTLGVRFGEQVKPAEFTRDHLGLVGLMVDATRNEK